MPSNLSQGGESFCDCRCCNVIELKCKLKKKKGWYIRRKPNSKTDVILANKHTHTHSSLSFPWKKIFKMPPGVDKEQFHFHLLRHFSSNINF